MLFPPFFEHYYACSLSEKRYKRGDVQGLIRHNSFFCHCRGRVKSAALPWLHGCHATRHAEGRGYGRGRVGGLNDEPSKRFGLTALAVMLWLVIAFKVLKVMEIVLLSLSSLSRFFSHTPSPLPWSSLAPPSKGDLADGSLGPTPLFAYPSPPS